MSDDRYFRTYFDRIARDEKFDGIRHSPVLFGSWSLLMIEAEKAWPAPFIRPPWVAPAPLRLFVERALIDAKGGGLYEVHGLDAERTRRSKHASEAAKAKWAAVGNAPSSPPGNARASSVADASRARAPRLVSSSGSSSGGRGVGEGLPHLTEDVASAWELATGLPILASGNFALTYLDDACRRHESAVVVAGIIAARHTFTTIPTPQQLTVAVRGRLDPLPDAKAAAAAEREQQAAESSRRGVEATLRQNHRTGFHVEPDPRCPLCQGEAA